ncbi:MAG: hypothetical protein LW834_06610 [Cyanobium sp. 49614_E6]|jgi:hypothetical protein|nr:hypothetical protein [Cyanobium sp. 49614_E6]
MSDPEPQAPGIPGEFIRDPGETEWRRDPAAITNEESPADPVEAPAPEQTAPALPTTDTETDGIQRPDFRNQSRRDKRDP